MSKPFDMELFFGWRSDRLARNAATPCATSKNHPGRNCEALATRNALGLVEKAFRLVS